ncbi:MAG: tyrosine-type recombinase/integrase [Labilibaculum sp.]|nr:tyrosine-type recombinase/integrase [Labilibaculum sp.]
MGQFSRKTINYVIKTAAKKAKLDNVHPHTLRHFCSYYMVNKGADLRIMQDYLGHRDPKHAVICTQISGSRFKSIWE